MKQDFTIPITVKAYSRREAEAKINLLLQGSAFVKDFDVPNLAGAIISHFVWAKLGETATKMRLEKQEAEAKARAKKKVTSIFEGIQTTEKRQETNQP